MTLSPSQSPVAQAVQTIWQPQPGPQTALVSCPVFEVFFGGARGGGKTEASIGDWLQHSGEYGEHAIGIFVRRKFKQLAEVIARTKQIFSKIGAKYNEQKAEWRMANGARLKFVYLERDSDAEEYQGHNYTRIYVEEVTNFPSSAPIDKLRATLRSTAGVPCGMRLTGNPGGPGHNWVKARYIDPDPRGYKIITESTEIEFADGARKTVSLDRIFIPSRLKDNHLLLENDPTYVLRLRQSGSEALVRAWLEGDWTIIDGAFFSEWDESLHVLDTALWLPRIPANALRFRSFDWGSARPFSVGWWAVSDGTWGLPRGAMVRYAEWYGASGPNKGLKMTADLVASGIVERERDDKTLGKIVRYGVADPAIFIRNGGPSIAESMMAKGCAWKPGDNKRRPGWEALRQRLVGADGRPMLYVFDCCDDTIRTLPTLQHDEIDSEDLDTEGEDHIADEIRYACMSRPWVPKQRTEPAITYPKRPDELTISELIEARRRKRLAAERESA